MVEFADLVQVGADLVGAKSLGQLAFDFLDALPLLLGPIDDGAALSRRLPGAIASSLGVSARSCSVSRAAAFRHK